MAYLFAISDHIVGLNLDEPEEALLIAAFVEAKRWVGQVAWLIDFEKRFFNDDKGVSDRVIGMINGVLKENAKLTLLFRPGLTGRTEYMTSRGERRMQSRAVILQTMMSQNGRAGLKFAEARASVATLPPLERAISSEQEMLMSKAAPVIDGLIKPFGSAEPPAVGLTRDELNQRARALREARERERISSEPSLAFQTETVDEAEPSLETANEAPPQEDHLEPPISTPVATELPPVWLTALLEALGPTLRALPAAIEALPRLTAALERLITLEATRRFDEPRARAPSSRELTAIARVSEPAAADTDDKGERWPDLTDLMTAAAPATRRGRPTNVELAARAAAGRAPLEIDRVGPTAKNGSAATSPVLAKKKKGRPTKAEVEARLQASNRLGTAVIDVPAPARGRPKSVKDVAPANVSSKAPKPINSYWRKTSTQAKTTSKSAASTADKTKRSPTAAGARQWGGR